ncbi:hypothetical protein V9L05_23840 (plasmid) [Bernardetia sp. Wsw4-3y2]|uniref:hypothetical protein n=1 Tax=Bernardetia sp. Wsw4-3y2 TaxID=3127471 RepID=UPI0030D409AC
MEEAAIKLELFRIIDSYEDELLQEMYNLIKEFQEKKEAELNEVLEHGYKAMSEDLEREEEADEWIEGTFETE